MTKRERSLLLVDREVFDHSVEISYIVSGRGWLYPLLLRVTSLHSSQDREATYQEVMELPTRQQLSSLTTNNSGELSSCFRA